MSFIEDQPVLVVCSVAVVSFGIGFVAYEGFAEAAGREILTHAEQLEYEQRDRDGISTETYNKLQVENSKLRSQIEELERLQNELTSNSDGNPVYQPASTQLIPSETNFTGVKISLTYLAERTVRRYDADVVTVRKVQPRVGRSWSHRLDYDAPDGKFIDIDSFTTSWREHSECNNGYTQYVVEQLSQSRIRVEMVGKEEGGFDKDCGASLEYSVSTFERVNELFPEETFQAQLSENPTFEVPQNSIVQSIELLLENGSKISVPFGTELESLFTVIDRQDQGIVQLLAKQ